MGDLLGKQETVKLLGLKMELNLCLLFWELLNEKEQLLAAYRTNCLMCISFGELRE